ncbi:MAG: glycosyltransferase family 9 protein, partial [Nitrospirota bacterium]
LIILLEPPHAALQAAPLLAALRRGFPAVRLEVLVPDHAASALAGNPNQDGILTASGSLMEKVRAVRSRRYELVIDLTNSPVSALLTRMAGAGIRIGYRAASTISKWLKRALCYTHTIMAKREQRGPVRHYLLVSEALGLDAAPPELSPDPGESPAMMKSMR